MPRQDAQLALAAGDGDRLDWLGEGDLLGGDDF